MLTFMENYVYACSAFPIQSRVPNLKSLAQVVFQILCSKRNWGHKFDLSRSHDHSIATTISYWWSFGTKSLSITVSEIFNVKCNTMVDVTLIRPLNKGQGHSFWYQSISHTTTSYRLSIVTFCSRTHHLATIQYITLQTTTTHATLA